MRRAISILIAPILLAMAVGLIGIPAHAEPDITAPARAYVAALVSHDGSQVPLTEDATRVEAGLKTGFSGPQIAADLTDGLQFRVIQKVRNERYTVAGDVVTADYVLDVGILGIKLASSTIHETFEMRDGKIHKIVADIRLGE